MVIVTRFAYLDLQICNQPIGDPYHHRYLINIYKDMSKTSSIIYLVLQQMKWNERDTIVNDDISFQYILHRMTHFALVQHKSLVGLNQSYIVGTAPIPSGKVSVTADVNFDGDSRCK